MGLLFLNAQIVQECFECWSDFEVSYFKGLIFYNIVIKVENKKKEDAIEKFDE